MLRSTYLMSHFPTNLTSSFRNIAKRYIHLDTCTLVVCQGSIQLPAYLPSKLQNRGPQFDRLHSDIPDTDFRMRSARSKTHAKDLSMSPPSSG